jgi:HPt (histidine-containing phosphotransfer) domain-containing protein
MPKKTVATTTSSIEIGGAIHPVIDPERLSILAEALGETKLIELRLTARQSILESAEALRLSWRDADLPTAARNAHRLSGVAANFGWPALAMIAGLIEKSCKSGDDGKRYTRQFEDVLTASLADIPPYSAN